MGDEQKEKKRRGRKPKEVVEDRGAGSILIVLDHVTGAARISHDNLELQEIVALENLLQSYVQQQLEIEKVSQIREQVMMELKKSDVEEKDSG